MGVGADDQRHPAVEKMPHRQLFAGRLAVDVDDDGMDVGAEPVRLQRLGDAGERIVERVHEQPRHDVDDQDVSPACRREHGNARPRGRPGIIVRAQNSFLGVEVRDDLALVEDVVAGGDRVRPGIEELVADLGRDAEAAGGVLAVDDDEVERELVAQPGEMLRHHRSARPANHVTANQNTHRSVPW